MNDTHQAVDAILLQLNFEKLLSICFFRVSESFTGDSKSEATIDNSVTIYKLSILLILIITSYSQYYLNAALRFK